MVYQICKITIKQIQSQIAIYVFSAVLNFTSLCDVHFTHHVVVMVRFRNASFEGFENDGFITATLVASIPASFPYTVVVIPTNSIPVSANSTEDYDDTPINVTFMPGSTEVDIRIPIVPDDIQEGLETFVLMLEVDVPGVFPALPLFAEVNIREQQSTYMYVCTNKFY